MDLAAFEELAIATFARVRGNDRVLGHRWSLGLDLDVVPGSARETVHGACLTLRLSVYEADTLRDMAEQELLLIPNAAYDERVPAFLEGIALGVRRYVEAGGEVLVLPHQLVPGFLDPDCQTAADYAARVGLAAPEPALPTADLTDLSGTDPIAADRDLERAIEDDPDRVDSHLVYADWLTECGDPRGEVIACMVPGASLEAQRRARAVMHANTRYFAGSLVGWPTITLDWALGWISEARIAVDYETTQRVDRFATKALRALIRHPSSKFLRALTLGVLDPSEGSYDVLHAILREGGPRPTLRSLFIGDTQPDEQELSWSDAGNLATLAGLYPRLVTLKIRGGDMSLAGGLDYPALESLTIECSGLAAANVAAIASTTFPALRELEIWFGSTHHGATATVADLAPILAGDRLPRLERLALRNAELTDELCAVIGDAPILARLRELDLAMGVMSSAGVAALVAKRPRFAHLAALDVSDNFLTADDMRALAALGIAIVSRGQRQTYADDFARYVAVAE